MPSKATYQFIEFVRPSGGYWPWPYSLEQAFGVFRWMIDVADPEKYHDKTEWGRRTVECLLSKKPSCTGMYEIDPINSLKDLEARFHYALLGNASNNVNRWRAHHDIGVSSKKIIHFDHAVPMRDAESEAQIQGAFVRLFGATGRLNVQLNECHDRAREIYGVRMHYSRGFPGWRFVLDYGYGGSVWHKTIARQRPKERMLPVLKRAVSVMDEWTHRS